MSNHYSTYEFPDDFIESLVCSDCQSYLSCGPIKVTPDGGTICGRCAGSSIEGSIRHDLFEAVLAKFAFPCRFKKQGCNQRLLFGAVEHEDVCPHRTFACPSLPHGTCMQDVCVFDVYSHFEEAHGDLIVKDNKFRLNLQADVQCNLLMSAENVVAAIQYMYHSDKQDLYLNIAQLSNNPQKRLSYKMEIVSGSDVDRSLNFKDYSCHLYECHAINQQTSRIFKICNYLSALEHPTFVFVIIMLQCVDNNAGTEEKCSQEGVINSMPLINAEQKISELVDDLEFIRCSCCRCIAIPPVYRQVSSDYHRMDTDKIICSKCKIRNSTPTREELVKTPEFPCCWRQCSFVGNETTIGNHIESCQFQTYSCPLPEHCFQGFYTRDTMINHIQQHGGQFFKDPKRIVIDLFCESSISKQYFSVFDDKLIAFTCQIVRKYEWSLSQSGSTRSTVAFDIHFEHGHCSFKSKTFPGTAFTGYKYSTLIEQLPTCFAKYKCMWAVLKIKNWRF